MIRYSRVTIRVTFAERERIRRESEDAGVCVSELMRARVLGVNLTEGQQALNHVRRFTRTVMEILRGKYGSSEVDRVAAEVAGLSDSEVNEQLKLRVRKVQ